MNLAAPGHLNGDRGLLTQLMVTSPEPTELVKDFWTTAYAAVGT